MKSPLNNLISAIIAKDGLKRPLQGKSLVATIFGDFVAPHGGKIWLGDLIQLVKHFNINERLLRTSVFRLVEEGWLDKRKIGRRSVYELSTEGEEQTVLASELIYHFKHKSWNGIWDLVIATSKDIPTEKNIQLHHRLSLMGFGILSKNIFAHPDMDNELVKNAIQELGLDRQVLLMQSQTIEDGDELSNKELVKQCCPYDEAEEMYNYFIRAYMPILDYLQETTQFTDTDCLRLRLLIVHDYRRLLFRDPQLPEELLPSDWSGDRARSLVRETYELTYKQANNYFLHVCEDDVLKPRLKKSFFSRFDGL